MIFPPRKRTIRAQGKCYAAMPRAGSEGDQPSGAGKADDRIPINPIPNKQIQQASKDSTLPHGGSKSELTKTRSEKKKARRTRLQKNKAEEISFNVMFHNVNAFTDVVKQCYMSEAVCDGGVGITWPVAVAMLQETRREAVPSFGKWAVHACAPGINIWGR